MELNLAAQQDVYQTEPFQCTWQAVSAYALGIGADADSLRWTWESHPDFCVLPSFAVIPTQPIVFAALRAINADFRTLVHGEQSIVMHAAIPVGEALTSRGKITEVLDKGKGAVVVIETETCSADGTLLFETRWSIFCRGQGGFGGPRGEKEQLPAALDGAEAVFEKIMQTTPEQALLYRLSGDYNPLHVDPNLAQKVGFQRPILHGLCTYGFAAKAIVENLCGNDVSKLKRFSARFSREVYPGDALHVSVVPADKDKSYRVVVSVADRIVLSNGYVELH